MKSILEFNRLEKENFSKINGGKKKATFKSWSANDCTYETSDSYDDVNGDGVRNCDETMVATTVVTCFDPCDPPA